MVLFAILRNKIDSNRRNNNMLVKPVIDVTIKGTSAKELEQQANVTAEEMAKIDANCRKSEHGLSVSQILLLEYCKKGKYPNPEGGYQRFWWFEYGIKSVGEVLKGLKSQGFIRFALPKELLTTLKVNELKNILSEMNLPSTGKKADLVERITQQVDEEELRRFIHSQRYVLTELGEKEVSDNEYVVYLHSHKYSEVSIWDVNQNANLKYWRDYIWGTFNKCSIEYASNGQWGLYRNVRLSMAEFLYEEKRYTDSFTMYGEVCFYDVNGMDIFIDYDSPSDLLPEGIISRMKSAVNSAGITEDQQRDILSKRISLLQAIKRRVPKGELPDMIIEKMKLMS